jgi:hypothetical protein
MATLGLTKLNAVNEILEAVNEGPFAALDTGGASIAADAERTLDRVNIRVQSRGWPENTVYSKAYTPTGGGFSITVSADTLSIRGAGPSGHRTLVLNADTVYDADNQTTNFGSAAPVYLDQVRLLNFIDCSPTLKDVIVAEAKVVFQQVRRGDPLQDQFATRARIEAENVADRPKPRINSRPLNQTPNVAVPQQGQGN